MIFINATRQGRAAAWWMGGILLFGVAALARPIGLVFELPLMAAASACCVEGTLRAHGGSSDLVRRATYGSFAIRWAVAIVLYCASAYGWPVLRSLQVGGGFWLFCMDALHYHLDTLAILDALKNGLPIPGEGGAIDYHLGIALIYTLFGASPLTAIAWNILAWTLAAVLLTGLLTELHGDAPLPAITVLAISFWPSGLFWPAQLMKDAWILLLLVMSARVIVHILAARTPVARLGFFAALVLVILPLVRLRVYVGRILLAALCVVAFVSAAQFVLRRWTVRPFCLAACAAIVIGTSVTWVPRFDPFSLLGPRKPTATEPAVASGPPRVPHVRVWSIQSLWSFLWRETVRLETAIDEDLIAMRPDQMGVMRQHFQAAGGTGIDGSSSRLAGWRDVVLLVPKTLTDAVLAPYPWESLRPRGVTGPFRSFAVSESLLAAVLLPAMLLGLLRIRHLDQIFIAAVAVGGLVALSLVITNLGTLFRLRAAFMLLLVGFSAFGADVYSTVARRTSRRQTGSAGP